MAKESIGPKGFRPLDQIPYSKLYDQQAVALRLQHQLLDILGGITVRRGNSATEDRITLGDMKGSPSDLTYEKFIDYFSTQLGLEKEYLATKNGEATVLININMAMNAARRFITQNLGLTLDPEATQAHATSLKEVYDIIKKTSQFSKSKGLTGPERLNRQASFCVMVLETLSAMELQKTAFSELTVDTEKIKNMLVSSPESGAESFFHHVGNPTDDFVQVVPNPNIASPLNLVQPLSIRYRDKTFESHMIKLGRKPEAQFNARDAVLDEVGFEIMFPRLKSNGETVRDTKTVVRTMSELVAHVIQKNGARKIEIENANFLTRDQCKQIRRLLSRRKLVEGRDYAFGKDTKQWLETKGDESDRENATSSRDFENLKFTYTVDVPGIGGNSRERNVEMQFADEVSSAHNIDSDHRIYKVRQYINLMTRRFGGCSKDWLDWMIGTALNEPGPRIRVSTDEVVALMLLNKQIVEMPDISKKKIYADPKVYKRQVAARLYNSTEIPKELNLIEHAARNRER